MGVSLAILVVGAAGIVLTAVFYLLREPNVPGRAVLLGFRLIALAVLILLLLNPRLPGAERGSTADGSATWVLIDSDLSLGIPTSAGGTLWDSVVGRAAELADGGARLALASPGEQRVEGIDTEALRARVPGYPPGDVPEAVVRLSEVGADSVTVLSSLRWSAEVVEALRREAPVPVRLERFGGTVRNAGVATLDLPATAREDEDLTGSLGVFGEGGSPGDSVRVELRANGMLLQTVDVALPPPGVEAEVPLALPPPPDTGRVRYTARSYLNGDVFPTDDLRARWLDVGAGERGIVLVSLRPDWEPRTLLPVLEAVTGLDGEGYLALADGRFLPLVTGGEAASPVSSERVRDRASRSEILVVQGAGGDGPAWLAAALADHPRVLHLVESEDGATIAGIAGGPPSTGEWTVVPDVPSSPLAPFLTGIGLGGLPPLVGVIPLVGPPSGIVGLTARDLRGGIPAPVLLLLESERGRRAVALAQGFWRWGVREGEARRAYRGLWGGVAEWLLVRPAVRGTAVVRPESILQPRGAPLRWTVAPSSPGLELSLEPVHNGWDGPWPPEQEVPGEAAFRGPLEPGEDGVASTPPVEPGIYRFVVRADDDSTVADGIVEVERWTPSLRRPPLDETGPILAAAGELAGGGDTGGRPLRTYPLAYLVLLFALCAEWLGRRRAGLR